MAREEHDVEVQDPGWAHCILVDSQKKRVKCTWCGKEMGGGVTRLKYHLAGIKGNVKSCHKCPRETSNEMRDLLTTKKVVKQIRAEEDADLLREISGRGGRSDTGKGIRTSTGGVSIRERRQVVEDSSDSDTEDSDPDLTAARKESMQTVREDEARRRGAGTSRGSGTFSSTAGTHSMGAAAPRGGYDPHRVGPMDSFVSRRRSASQPKIKQALRGVKKSAEVASHAFKSIVKWFAHAGVPAHAAESPYFQDMIDAIAESGPGIKAPTRRDIYGRGLDMEYAELQQWVQTFKNVWRERGCTIMCDGWTGTTKKSMINFLVYYVEGTIFMKSIDASQYTKNVNYLFNLMDQIVQEVGEENVVQIVTDNEASYKAAGKKLMEKRKHLYWVPCAAHSLDLMLEDIGKDKHVKNTVQKAQKVTQFIYGHPRILNLMRGTATGGRDLIRAGPTRFASNFISLESLMRYQNELKSFVNGKDFLNYVDTLTSDGQCDALEIMEILEDKKFWSSVSHYLVVVEPLVHVLKMVDGDDKNDMGYLYGGMEVAKEKIRIKYPKAYKKWWSIVDHRWESTLHHDLHAAGKTYYWHC